MANHTNGLQPVPCGAPPADHALHGTAPCCQPTCCTPPEQCVEVIQLPPLAECHHYVNLTNGIEAIPRLQQLGLPYRHGGCPAPIPPRHACWQVSLAVAARCPGPPLPA